MSLRASSDARLGYSLLKARRAPFHPRLISGTLVTLGSPTSQAGITVTTALSTVNSGQMGLVQVVAGNTPGFYSFSIRATDLRISKSPGGTGVLARTSAVSLYLSFCNSCRIISPSRQNLKIATPAVRISQPMPALAALFAC